MVLPRCTRVAAPDDAAPVHQDAADGNASFPQAELGRFDGGV